MSSHELIKRNAREIRGRMALFERVMRERGREAARAAVIATYGERTEALDFPGGYEAGLAALDAGDPDVVETALAFLEVRPYFNHSQYMFDVLLRRVKRAALDAGQRERLTIVLRDRAERGKMRAERKRSMRLPCDLCGHARSLHHPRKKCYDCPPKAKCNAVYSSPKWDDA